MEEQVVVGKVNKRALIENYFYIVDKDSNDVLLKFNSAQDDIYNTIKAERERNPNKRILILVLKARQLGMSTFTEALGCAESITKRNQSMLIMTHKSDSTDQLYRMTQNYINKLPPALKPSIIKNNENMIIFDTPQHDGLNSKVQVMTASKNSKGAGRGFTFSYVHLSEFDWWECDAMLMLTSILSACNKRAIVIIETTANGCGNFKRLWDKAVSHDENNEWIPKFYGWWSDREYEKDYGSLSLEELDYEEEDLVKLFRREMKGITDETIKRKLAWRRVKILTDCQGDINLFHQEFPSTPEEAFISSGECVFDLNKIATRKRELERCSSEYEDKGYYTYDIDFDVEMRERRIRNIKWVSDHKAGYVVKYRKPQKRVPYVTVLDPAGTGSDASAQVVLNNITCEQVALLHVNKMSSLELACQSLALAYEYNTALLSSETNFAPEIVQYYKEFQYPKLYVQENNEGIGVQIIKKYGLRTTTVTRPKYIDCLKNYINSSIGLVNSMATLVEAENFVRVKIDTNTPNTALFKEMANEGSHDDIIMSLGMTLFMRESGQQEFKLMAEEEIAKPINKEYEMLFGSNDMDVSIRNEDMVYYDD